MPCDLDSLKRELQKLCCDAQESSQQLKRVADLPEAKARFLGRKGAFGPVMRLLGQLSPEERPAAGELINSAKSKVDGCFCEAKMRLEQAALEAKLQEGRVDVTMPGRRLLPGGMHPVQRVLDEVTDLLGELGFELVSGPEVETEHYNFDLLNMPADHPARDMQDTFFVEGGLVLRTQTSPMQVRTMEKRQPPVRVMAPGKVFRCDFDATHSPTFHQLEGLWIDRDVTMADLKGILTYFLRRLFGEDREVRFRPSFFPFTEPSVEVDVRNDAGNWMEVLGAGMVHPQVLRNVGYDPEQVQGFAFGMGIDRLAMVRYRITDIRALFENDQRFLRQF